MEIRYVELGKRGEKIYLYEDRELNKKFRQVLWGDQLRVECEEDELLKVKWAPNSGVKNKTLYIPIAHTTQKRPLEIIFVDVGQGDGCVLIAPEEGNYRKKKNSERVVVIDAGPGSHMREFLRKRFGSYRSFDFEAAVLTHPDKDHYKGFESIFNDREIGFNTIYHNGLLERPSGKEFEKLGGLTKDGLPCYLKELAVCQSYVKQHFSDKSTFGKYKFPPVMHAALINPSIKDIKMLSTHHGVEANGKRYVPGFESCKMRNYAIEVLGPVVEFSKSGKPQLRRIGGYAETKNGHSVLLRLTIGGFSVFFGGDLNEKAEMFLLTHYGIQKFPNQVTEIPQKGTCAYNKMVRCAAKHFHSDVMKVCHHGSQKVTDAFLETVNPACFIISSGDAEGYVHPRPDLLGRLGRHGRGEAPVLLLTELQRSTREYEDPELVKKLQDKVDKLAKNPVESLLQEVKSCIDKLAATNVDVYGSIYVKTDGKRLITACKIETGSKTKRWFYFEYVFKNGELVRCE